MVEEEQQTRSAIAIAHGVYAAAQKSGVEGMLECWDELIADDFEWIPALVGTIEGGRTYVGRDEFADYVADFKSVFKEATFGEATFEPRGPERVLITAPMHVRGTGSGLPLEMDVAYVLEVRDGRGRRCRTFFSKGEAEEFLADA